MTETVKQMMAWLGFHTGRSEITFTHVRNI